ncbi:MAG: AAA family ATPase, partial [Terriglobales bacterium]
MLKLKKLQILGFKSFCDRTELRFHGDGVAAIVGPNGCGKSNIADAICWVLGEQSAKSLRGTRMEDVIFAGTPARKATGMAEVSLTLVDPELFEGAVGTEPEIEISEELPEEDWDEAALRAAADDDTDQYMAALQPGIVADDQSRAASKATGHQQVVESPEPNTDGQEQGTEGLHTHVVLKIRRRKFKPMPLKKGEIIVTRRLFRSGDSEYLLNHKLCRLRDIQDIFMGTGLGPESYAIIEQGRIGQILSSKPTDRRAIIEEAAGITKYKTRKRLAEARLEDARQNLNRVNDIFEEVTRQMNSLKRQAAKASRYVRLRDEMKAKLRLVLSSRFAQLQSEAGTAQSELQRTDEQVKSLNTGVQQMDAEHSERIQRGYSLDAALRQCQESKAAIAREIDRAISRKRQNEERCAELAERTTTAERELAETSVKLEALLAERAVNRAVLDSADSEAAGIQEELSARQQDASSAAVALSALEKQQEMRRVSILEAANAAAGVRNRITQAEENMAALTRESQRLQSEISAAHLQLESFGGERGQLVLEFESAAQRVEALA